MEEKKGLVKKLDSFIEGRGFYIVLLACVAVISLAAISLWVPNFDLFGADNAVREREDGYYPAMADSTDDGEGDEAEPGTPETEPGGIVGDSAVPEADETEAGEEGGSGEDGAEAETPAYTEPAAVPAAGEIVVEAGEISFIWPVSGEISQPYAADHLVFSKTMGDWRTHNGVDIAAKLGEKVVAAADGTVEKLYKDDLFGTCIVIDHGRGLSTLYANLAAVPTVEEGEAVEQGQVIGSVGDTALAETGEVTHLHFAVRLDDFWADPMNYLT